MPEDAPRRRATMRDVALRAGVSVATVSNVLNGSKPVSPETLRMVEAAVAALSYQPNPIARSLIARRARPAEPGRRDAPRLVAVGYLSIDYVAAVPALPRADDRLTARGVEKMVGGPAANVAAFAAGLGPPCELRVEMLTQIGDDADSDWALTELAARGVDASGAIRTPGARLSRAIVLVDAAGRRAIVNEPLTVAGADVEAHLDREPRAAPATWVHVDGFQVAHVARSAPALRARGVGLSAHMTGLDAAWRSAEGFERSRRLFDLVFLNREVARAMVEVGPETDDAALAAQVDARVQAGARRDGAALLTLGPRGAALLRPGEDPVFAEAESVAPVDTTGAGDAFTGVFLAAFLTAGDPETALCCAVRGASLSITVLGAQGRRITAADLGLAAVAGAA